MATATTKPISVTYFPVNTAVDMAHTLVAALNIDYRGTITAHKNPDTGEVVWVLELNGPGNPFPVTVTVGDVVVWDGTKLLDFTAAAFADKYSV